MNHVYTFINVVLTFLIAFILLQVIPTLISSTNEVEFYIGIVLGLFGLAVVWKQGIEIYNDLIKGKE